MNTLAVVAHPPAAPALVARELPVSADDEVIVEVGAAGLCHTDVYLLSGAHPAATYPRIPGHEFAGVVVSVGLAVPNHVVRGLRVAVQSTVPCLECASCAWDDFRDCPNTIYLGTDADGGWQTHAVVPWRALVPLPDWVSFNEAALYEPAANAFAALEAAGVSQHDDVVIVGPGAIGTLAAMLAAYLQPRSLTVVGLPRDEGRLRLIETLTGSNTLVLTESDGASPPLRPASVVIQCAPSTRASAVALEMLADGGRLVIEGYAGDPTPLQIGADEVLRRSLTIRGVNGWTPHDFLGVASLVGSRSISFERLPVASFGLHELESALELLHHPGEAVRAAFHPNGSM
jgi:threonine dehydrogenase-like Zn-dependent dehydrogenase